MIVDNSEINFQKLSLSKTSSTSKTTAFNVFFLSFFFSLKNIQLNMRRSFHICNFFLNDEKNYQVTNYWASHIQQLSMCIKQYNPSMT